eukprot:1343316-Prymnesium_polylepis.1
MGNIILWTGPHLGVTSDKTFWDQTWAWHPFFPWEWWLADVGYVGALGLLYKWKKASQQPTRRPPPDLTPQELFYNNIHEFYSFDPALREPRIKRFVEAAPPPEG